MPEIKKYMPTKIDNYIEPFVGGGRSFLNVKTNHYYVNDIDSAIIRIHKLLHDYAKDKNKFFEKAFSIINIMDCHVHTMAI